MATLPYTISTCHSKHASCIKNLVKMCSPFLHAKFILVFNFPLSFFQTWLFFVLRTIDQRQRERERDFLPLDPHAPQSKGTSLS